MITLMWPLYLLLDIVVLTAIGFIVSDIWDKCEPPFGLRSRNERS